MIRRSRIAMSCALGLSAVVGVVGIACTGEDPDLAKSTSQDGGAPDREDDASPAPAKLSIAVAKDFYIQTGTAKKLTVDVTRPTGNTEAVSLTVSGLPPGVSTTASTISVPAGATSADFELTAQGAQAIAHASIKATLGSLDATSDFDVTVRGAPGTRDELFGTNGILDLPDIGISGSTVDASGAVYVLGSKFGSCRVLRLTTKGAIDTSFGDQGVATWQSTAQSCFFIAAQSDGKLVVATIDDSDAAGRRVLLARLLAQKVDGSFLDATFGNGGIVAVDDTDDPFALSIDGQNRVILTGQLAGGGKSFVRRFSATGQVDTSLVIDAKVSALAPSHTSAGPQDSLLVGYYDPAADDGGATPPYGYYRVDSAGKLDTTWGNGGKLALKNHTAPDYKRLASTGIALDGMGNAIVLGMAVNVDDKGIATYVGKITKSGVYDPTWLGGGYAPLYGELLDDQMQFGFAAPEPSGAVITTGYRTIYTTDETQLYVVRFAANGELDSSFRDKTSTSDGVVTLPISTAVKGRTRPYGIALQTERVAVAFGAGDASKVLRLWR